jgi:signal transduction histidine kinase
VPTELTPIPLPPADPVLHLHDLLGECEERLLDGWSAIVLRQPGRPTRPDALPHPGERHREDLLSFLMDLKSALRRAAADGIPASTSPGTEADEEGGSGGGLDPAAATRGYGFLHGLILEIAAERSVEVCLAEHRTLVSYLSEAVARAVAGYLRAEQRELHRIAHGLRNPLGSAMMALTLLRSRVDLGGHARLGEMLERNLQRLEQGLEELLTRRRLDEPDNTALVP